MTNNNTNVTSPKYGKYDEFRGETHDGWSFEVCVWADVATVFVPNLFTMAPPHASQRISATDAFELLAEAGGMTRQELLDRIVGQETDDMPDQPFTQEESDYLYGSLEADKEREEDRLFSEWFYSQVA